MAQLPRRLPAFILAACVAVTIVAVFVIRSDAFAELLASSAQQSDQQVAATSEYFSPRQTIELSTGAARQSPNQTQGWPQLFGPTHDSVSLDTDVLTEWPSSGPPVLWRRAVGTGYTSPVVWNDQLVVLHRLGDEEIVECLNVESGMPTWEYRYPTAYQCPYEHSSGPYSTPVIDGEFVYTLSAEGKLHCLNLVDGRLAWQRSLNDEFKVPPGIYAVGHSPLLEEDRLILNVGGPNDAGIVALDKSTGKTLWGTTSRGASYATPRAATVHGRRIVFVLTAFGLAAIDPTNGSLLWEKEFHAAQPDAVSATSPLVYGDILLISAYQAGSLCLRMLPDGKTEELWRNRRTLVSQFNPLTCVDGFVYGWHLLDKSFRCIELSTGKLRWTYKSAVCRGTHVAVGNRMILLGEYGELASVDINPNEAIERAVTAEGLLTGPCFSAPALHDGRLFVRNERELLCLDLRRPANGTRP